MEWELWMLCGCHVAGNAMANGKKQTAKGANAAEDKGQKQKAEMQHSTAIRLFMKKQFQYSCLPYA